MNTYKVHYVLNCYGTLLIEANSKEEAQNVFKKCNKQHLDHGTKDLVDYIIDTVEIKEQAITKL
jgi:hypothetical protein